MIPTLNLLAWSATALAGFGWNALEASVIYLPEPPKHFIEIAAIGTVVCIAVWRRA